MRASFIKARKKHLLSMFSKIWIGFISFVVVLLGVFNIFIVYKTSDFRSSVVDLNNERLGLEQNIDAIDEQIGFILRQKAVAEEIYANNIILKDSIKNLFDLVPDQITLTKVHMQEDSLVIYGVTPTKDTYNFLLAAPLKSIFHQSDTVFYLSDEGWYNFVSTNKIIPADRLEE